MAAQKYEVCILAKGGESFLSEVEIWKSISEIERSRLRRLAAEWENDGEVRTQRNQQIGDSINEPV